MLRLAVPESVRQAVSSSIATSYHLAWYCDFADALHVAPTVQAMWLRPSDINVAQGSDLIARASNLSWLHVSRVGVDVLPLDEMARREIVLTNGAGLTADAIAEHAIMCMLALRRGLPALLQAQARASWSQEIGRGDRLEGSVALVIGYGHVGRAIVSRARKLGVNAIAARRRRPAKDEEGNVVGDAWRELLAIVDFLVLAVPLTDESRNLVGKNELASLKPGAVVINVARGEVLDVDYLTESIADGRLGGAALDCFEEEPLPSSSPLWKLSNVIITPHIAWLDSGFGPRELQLFEDNARRFVKGDQLRNVVDLRAGY
jgi:phosphoglycerate dehydrogenase-like enzyme